MKKPYQIRIEPDLLEKLRKKATYNYTTVSHEIRQAIIKHIKE